MDNKNIQVWSVSLLSNYQKIVVLNTKGGAGKTTLATNLAAYYASSGVSTALMDFDPQGSSTFWLSQRSEDLPSIQSVPAYKYKHNVTQSWFFRTKPDTRCVIVDSPAGIELTASRQLLDKATAILIPVLPSEIDIHAASHCIADLLLLAKQHKRRNRIGVVANRVRKNALMFKRLEKFLHSLDIPFVTTLRDTTLYTQASGQGMGIHELKSYRAKQDLENWTDIIDWLEVNAESEVKTAG